MFVAGESANDDAGEHGANEHKTMAVRLGHDDARLRMALKAANMGAWELDMQTEVAVRTPEHDAIFGYHGDSLDWNFNKFLAHVHPSDRASVEAAFKRAAESDTDWEVECRIFRTDGAMRWIWVQGSVSHSGGNDRARMFGLVKDITERKQADGELIEAREHAEQMNRVKTALLANMSHEVRTPLTAILGYSSLMARQAPHKYRAMLKRIETAGNRLLETLESVLLLSRLESETTELKQEAVAVFPLVRETVELLRPAAEAKGLDLRSVAEAGLKHTRLRLDGTALGRIAENLVSNAIKFTDEGSVTVRVLKKEDELVIEVEDSGIGIDEEFRSHVFHPFVQESDGLDRSYDGTGLGLSIAQRLTEEMGGTITLESEKGRGSTFRVSFPIASAGREEASEFEEAGKVSPSPNLVKVLGVDGDQGVPSRPTGEYPHSRNVIPGRPEGSPGYG